MTTKGSKSLGWLFAATAVTLALAAVDPTTIKDSSIPPQHFTAWAMIVSGSALLALSAPHLVDLLAQGIKLPVRIAAVWIGWSFAAAVGGDDVAVGVAYSIGYAGVGAAMVVIAQKRRWFGVSVVLLVGCGVYAAIGIPALLRDDSLWIRGDGLRLVSLESNQLARVVAIGILSAAYVAVRSRGVRQAAALALLVFGLGTLWITESRTALAALLAALALLTLTQIRGPARIALLGLGLLVAAGLFATDRIDTKLDFLSHDATGQQIDIQTISGRTELWPHIVEHSIDDVALTGAGPGTDAVFMSQLRYEGEIAFIAKHTHNIALHTLVTTGVVGLALLVMLLGVLGYRAIVEPHPWRDAMLVLLIIDGLAEPVIRVPAFGFAALVAVAAMGRRQSSANATSLRNLRFRSEIPFRRRGPWSERSRGRRPAVRSTTGS